jgi:hypothetical protein
MMSNDVKSAIVFVRNPSGAPGDLGESDFVFYVIKGDTLIMTDRAGRPRRHNNGEIWSEKLAPDSNPATIARRLFRAARREEDPSVDFNRPINYPNKVKVPV